MTLELSDVDLNAVVAPSLLDAARAERRVRAAQELRLAQAWAGVFATMLETGTCSVDDIVNADAAYTASVRRSGEALHALGALLTCEGLA